MSRTGWPVRAGILVLLVAGVWGSSALWDKSAAADAAARPLNPPVRVRLQAFREAKRVPLEITGDWRVVTPGSGHLLAEGSNFHGELSVDERGIVLGFWVFETRQIRLETGGDAALRIGGHGYRGSLLVEAKGDRLPETLELKLELPLEDYVLGVVCGEMPTSASGAGEALRAQAVAARTYALWRLRSLKRDFLRDDAEDQRFHGVDYETGAARQAVAATHGRILTWEEEILPAYFHADCGGSTENAFEAGFVRSEMKPLSGVEDPGCRHAVGWHHAVSTEVLDRFAREHGLGDWLGQLAAEEVRPSGRWAVARVEGPNASRVVSASHIASLFGTPSRMWTRVQGREDGSLVVEGSGRGHGVGLCQEGALDHAREGWDFTTILDHYYPGARLDYLTELPRDFP